jgi:hypothetical protein
MFFFQENFIFGGPKFVQSNLGGGIVGRGTIFIVGGLQDHNQLTSHPACGKVMIERHSNFEIASVNTEWVRWEFVPMVGDHGESISVSDNPMKWV